MFDFKPFVQGKRRPQAAGALLLCVSLGLLPATGVEAQTLKGSKLSMSRQNEQARKHGFEFMVTRQDVRDAIASGALVHVPGNGDYFLKEVSFPYARPEVKVFIERLAARYADVCHEPLVVTSLTRPRRHQPANASHNSVHPTGMALDLRRSWSRRCRSWLEGVLLTFEGRGLLEATLEWRPPHYHLALFPEPYRQHLAKVAGLPLEEEFKTSRYRVARGDTLFKIAARHRTTVEMVKRGNGLRSDRIYPGQILVLPEGR